MRNVCRQFSWVAAIALVLGLTFANARPAAAQTTTFPAWVNDSDSVSNKYLLLWEYFRNAELTRYNIWTELGDPFNSGDDFFFEFFIDPNNGNRTLQCPWGSRLFSSQQPTFCVVGNNGRTTGDDRPIANHLTLHVQDPTTANPNGYTDMEYPEDGTPIFGPPVVSLPDAQGFFAPYNFGTPGTANGIDLTVNQRVAFARDLMRIEVVIRNNSGTTRNVGARLLLDSYVDFMGATRSVFLPNTRERVLYEKEFRGAQVPPEWEVYDDDEGPSPVYVSKGILRGNGATTPSRVIFGNTRDMFPFVQANAVYDWTVRPDFELRISDIGALIYWDPVTIPAGQSRSFVTYAGMGVASHGMSDAYIATQASVNAQNQQGQGFVSAVQTPFALPVVDGNVDLQESTVNAFIQNVFSFSMPNTFGFIELPDGLEFASSDPLQPARLDLGSLGNVGSLVDEGQGFWTIQANGQFAGLLPITVTFGNGFQDSARTTRILNVPQGRRYQFKDDWKMVTFPFSYDLLQDDPAEVFKELDGVTALPTSSYKIVRYNPQINQYEEVTQIRAGEGYWVRMQGLGDTYIRLGEQAEPVKLGTRDIFTSFIIRGWNQVGNPSPYTVKLREMKFLGAGGVIITYDQAVSQNLIRGAIFRYDIKTGQYVQLAKEDTIAPGQGLWIFSNGERTIVWPPPQGPGVVITP